MFISSKVISKGLTPTVGELYELITPELGGVQFARVFMLLALSSFLCPNSRGVCSCQYYPAIINVVSIRDLDWCSFVLDWFISYVRKFKDSNGKRARRSNGGCAMLLVISYLEFLSTPEFNFGTQAPHLNLWSTTTVQTMTLLDSKPGDSNQFGRLPIYPCQKTS
uniref:Uncharacterized protein n=1 Tax=Arundo donax TaxID=35708 RepID=A0A0A9SA29_ARUDO